MNGEYWTQGRASHFGLKNIHSSGVWTKGKTMFSTTTTSDEAKFGNHAVSQLRGWVSLQSGQDVLERVKTLLWMMTRTSLFLLSLSFLSFFLSSRQLNVVASVDLEPLVSTQRWHHSKVFFSNSVKRQRTSVWTYTSVRDVPLPW